MEDTLKAKVILSASRFVLVSCSTLFNSKSLVESLSLICSTLVLGKCQPPLFCFVELLGRQTTLSQSGVIELE